LNILQYERELLRSQARRTLKQEDTMSKHLSTPISRLVCFGSAKAVTLAGDIGEPEPDVGQLFE